MTFTASDLIQLAYSPDTFRAAVTEWQQQLTQHLQTVSSGHGPVLNWHEPQQSIDLATKFLQSAPHTGDPLPEQWLARFREILRHMLASGQNLHHPHYIGHQVPASVPLAGLFDALGSVTNQVMAIYEMGPWSTAVESALISALSRRIGWEPEHSSGLLTHGGSLANLTALLTARNVVFPGSWEQGVPREAVLVAQADAHYCVARSAGILGLGTQQIIKVQLDARRRMRPDHLDEVLTQVRASGQRALAVSCCACATPTGAFDPLEAIADICQRHGVWLHVDAAHGGSALMSRRHRHLLNGIVHADSVVWDAHKMLFVPALCAAVLYRRREVRFETFQQSAPYLFDPSAPGMADYDSGMRTVECTKRAAGFGLWGLWAVLGDQLFEQLVDHAFAQARAFWELLQNTPDFVPLHEPECNIVAFRYLPPAVAAAPVELQNRFQREVRQRLIRSGSFYIVQTQLQDLAALRVTFMNPLTTADDLQELLAALRETGRAVASQLSTGGQQEPQE